MLDKRYQKRPAHNQPHQVRKLTLKRITLAAAVLVFLLVYDAKIALGEVFLKCEGTDEFMRKGQDWFVDIEDMTNGAVITLKQIYSTGESESTYRIWFIDETIIRAARQLKENQPVDPNKQLRIDRETGRMWEGQLYTVKELEDFWNEEKKQTGGFKKDTWFGTNFDCEVGKKLF